MMAPKLPCTIKGCDKKYTTAKSLRNHMKNIHEGLKFKCITCEKVFASQYSLRRHSLSVHNSAAEGEKITVSVDEALNEQEQDAIIQQQVHKIKVLKDKLQKLKGEVKKLREELLYAHTVKDDSNKLQ